MAVDRQSVRMKGILRKSFGLLDGFQLLAQSPLPCTLHPPIDFRLV